MPELERPDGTRIHYEVDGEDGPAVVLATYWWWCPGVYGELLADLATDHRVVTYHLRGTGNSSRNGPYDMETDIADLEAVVEAAEGATIVLSTADSANRSAKLAARRPELVPSVVSLGTAPISRKAFEGREGMLASDTVVQAFLEMLEHNYRGGMRTLIEATNTQMSEDELRERAHAQVEFCPADAALGRLRAWAEDDPLREAGAIGDRLWIFAAPSAAGQWLPSADEQARITEQMLPQANVLEFEEESGPTSQPHDTAEAVRQITATLGAGAAQERK
jgi:pimeloyl-ACP methyl ester carboxylesterase